MFERYTEKARRVIFFARYEASQLGAQAIEVEHLLLGLLREDKQLAQLLFSTPRSSIEAIRKAIEATGPLREKVSATVDLPLAPATKRVLMYAADESKRLQHRHIGPEHLLLGILREDKSLAARLLIECGVTAEKVIAIGTEVARGLRDAGLLPEAAPIDPFGKATPPLQLYRQLGTMMRLLIERDISPDESLEEFDWSPMHLHFISYLDLLVSKGIISQEEKQRIIEVKR